MVWGTEGVNRKRCLDKLSSLGLGIKETFEVVY